MADLELFAPGLRAAPLIYDVPGGQEINLKVLAATFDGSGAGSPWQPAVQIVGPSGQVLRTFALEPALAAGASADVTFFPGGGIKTPAASGVQSLAAGPVTGQIIASGAGTVYFDMDAPNFWTNDPATFALQTWAAGGAENGHTGIGLLALGTYLVTYSALFRVVDAGHNVANPWTVTVEWTESDGYVILLDNIGNGLDQNTGLLDNLGAGLAYWSVFDQVLYENVTGFPLDTPFILQAKQASGQSLIVEGGIMIQKLNDQVPFP
jgi:hypothetical protein